MSREMQSLALFIYKNQKQQIYSKKGGRDREIWRGECRKTKIKGMLRKRRDTRKEWHIKSRGVYVKTQENQDDKAKIGWKEWG